MSLTVSQIIRDVNAAHPDVWSSPQIATTVAFICGFIVLGLGLLRLGWIVEFIPAPAVSGFMTGSAISIAAGQVPGLMGITGFEYVFSWSRRSFGLELTLHQHSGRNIQGYHQYPEGTSWNN